MQARPPVPPRQSASHSNVPIRVHLRSSAAKSSCLRHTLAFVANQPDLALQRRSPPRHRPASSGPPGASTTLVSRHSRANPSAATRTPRASDAQSVRRPERQTPRASDAQSIRRPEHQTITEPLSVLPTQRRAPRPTPPPVPPPHPPPHHAPPAKCIRPPQPLRPEKPPPPAPPQGNPRDPPTRIFPPQRHTPREPVRCPRRISARSAPSAVDLPSYPPKPPLQPSAATPGAQRIARRTPPPRTTLAASRPRTTPPRRRARSPCPHEQPILDRPAGFRYCDLFAIRRFPLPRRCARRGEPRTHPCTTCHGASRPAPPPRSPPSHSRA